MTSMLQIELPEIVSKTPIPSGKKLCLFLFCLNKLFYLLTASNTLDPMNLQRSESRNTIGPSFKLQFDGAFKHISTMEDEKKKISEQVFFINNELPRYNGTLCIS
jgi:hypothetical protein